MSIEYRILDKPHIRKASPKQDGKNYEKRARHAWPWLVILELNDFGQDRGMAFSSFENAAAFARKEAHERKQITDHALFAAHARRKYGPV